jgi:hypothetical protein
VICLWVVGVALLTMVAPSGREKGSTSIGKRGGDICPWGSTAFTASLAFSGMPAMPRS